MKNKWIENKEPCWGCGRKDGFCTRTENGEVNKCNRAPNDRPVKQKDGTTAYLYVAENLGVKPLGMKKAKPELPKLGKADLDRIIKQLRTAISPDRLASTAKSLGVSERSLKLYDIGLDARQDYISFPMRDGEQKPIGVRLRSRDGKAKICVTGSRNGLFIPTNYAVEPIPDGVCNDPKGTGETAYPLLLLPEGPTDCCAAADLGYRAVGRPSNTGGAQLIKKLLSTSPKQDVIILADHDTPKWLPDGTPFWPGIEGAVNLAHEILSFCGTLRLMFPPDGAKDLRAWLNSGGTPTRLAAHILDDKNHTPRCSRVWIEDAQQLMRFRKIFTKILIRSGKFDKDAAIAQADIALEPLRIDHKEEPMRWVPRAKRWMAKAEQRLLELARARKQASVETEVVI